MSAVVAAALEGDAHALRALQRTHGNHVVQQVVAQLQLDAQEVSTDEARPWTGRSVGRLNGVLRHAPLVAGEADAASFHDLDDAVTHARVGGRAAVVVPSDGWFVVHPVEADADLDYRGVAHNPLLGGRSVEIGGEPRRQAHLLLSADVAAFVTSDGAAFRPHARSAHAPGRALLAQDRVSLPRGGARWDTLRDELVEREPAACLSVVDVALHDLAMEALDRGAQEAREQRATFRVAIPDADKPRIEHACAEVPRLDQEIARVRALVRDRARRRHREGPDGPGRPVAALASFAQWDASDERRLTELEAAREQAIYAYPLLAYIVREGDLDAFVRASWDGRAMILGSVVDAVEHGISATRRRILDRRLDPWGIEALVQGTVDRLGADPEVRTAALARCHDTRARQAREDLALAVLEVGLVALGLLASGGMAAPVFVASAGLAAVGAVKATDDYLEERAASHTALDPRTSLVPLDEVQHSLHGVVLAWIGIGMDGVEAVKIVRALQGGRRLADVTRFVNQTPEAMLRASGRIEETAEGAWVWVAHSAAEYDLVTRGGADEWWMLGGLRVQAVRPLSRPARGAQVEHLAAEALPPGMEAGDVAVRMDRWGRPDGVLVGPRVASSVDVSVHVGLAEELGSVVARVRLWLHALWDRLAAAPGLTPAQLRVARLELRKHEQMLDAYAASLADAPLTERELRAVLLRSERVAEVRDHWEAVLRGERAADAVDASLVFSRGPHDSSMP